MNRITLIGYLGKVSEQRTTRSNAAFTVLSLATRKSWKDRDGARQPRTEWHRCLVWKDKLAAFAATLTPGAHIQFEGELVSREYQKDGVTHRIVEVARGPSSRSKGREGTARRRRNASERAIQEDHAMNTEFTVRDLKTPAAREAIIQLHYGLHPHSG